jgi:hypothetical protein
VRAFKQLLREFWLPLLLAICWTSFVYAQKGTSLIESVTNFSTAFFLCSWATGQFFRVNKQIKVESQFVEVGDRLKILTGRLENKTDELLSSISGGDSYCVFALTNDDENAPTNLLMASHEGKHPLYDVVARVVDLDDFEGRSYPTSLIDFQAQDSVFSLGDMIPAHSLVAGQVANSNAGIKRFNIFWSARNGSFTQVLRYAFDGQIWHMATRIRKNQGAESELIYEKIPEGYPLQFE